MTEIPLTPARLREEANDRTAPIGDFRRLLREAADALDAALKERDEARIKCHVCGKPASCIGAYEGTSLFEPACDACCGHGNEDGACKPITEWIEWAAKNLVELEASVDAAAARVEAEQEQVAVQPDEREADLRNSDGARMVSGAGQNGSVVSGGPR